MYRRQQGQPREKFRVRKQKNCGFCEKGTNPDYKDTPLLRSFMSERGKIVPYFKSSLCSKHQRRMSVAVKRARFLALLPFVA